MQVKFNTFKELNNTSLNYDFKKKNKVTKTSQNLNINSNNYPYSKDVVFALKNHSISFGKALPFDKNKKATQKKIPIAQNVRRAWEDLPYRERRSQFITRVNNAMQNLRRNLANVNTPIENQNPQNTNININPSVRGYINSAINGSRIRYNSILNIIRSNALNDPTLLNNLNNIRAGLNFSSRENAMNSFAKLLLIEKLLLSKVEGHDKFFKLAENLITPDFMNNNIFAFAKDPKIYHVSEAEREMEYTIFITPKESNDEILGFKIGDFELGNIQLATFELLYTADDSNDSDDFAHRKVDNFRLEAKPGKEITGLKANIYEVSSFSTNVDKTYFDPEQHSFKDIHGISEIYTYDMQEIETGWSDSSEDNQLNPAEQSNETSDNTISQILYFTSETNQKITADNLPSYDWDQSNDTDHSDQVHLYWRNNDIILELSEIHFSDVQIRR